MIMHDISKYYQNYLEIFIDIDVEGESVEHQVILFPIKAALIDVFRRESIDVSVLRFDKN